MKYDVVLVEQVPNCDICIRKNDVKNAIYDAKTVFGMWGYLCEECYGKYGLGLGIGLGQRLVLKGVTPCLHSEH